MANNKILVSTVCGIALLLNGCATTSVDSAPHKDDPYESFNRKVYSFNKVIDNALLKPIAYVYWEYTPKVFQGCVHNFFANLAEVTTIANDFLQGKFAYIVHDTSRLIINSTIGLGGLFDPASKIGLERHVEDFGQTLQTWGATTSPYLVLPLLGPSTIRDTVGYFADYYAFSVWPHISPDRDKNRLMIANVIDLRSNKLSAVAVVEAIGIDEYVFVRNAYFQQRQSASIEDKTKAELESEDPLESEDDDWLFGDDEEGISTKDDDPDEEESNTAGSDPNMVDNDPGDPAPPQNDKA